MNNLKEYILEKLKIDKNIDVNIHKYFLDLDFYDPKEDNCYGDMEYVTNQMGEKWWDSPQELLDDVKEHIEDDIKNFGDSDDYAIPIYSIQQREYDSEKISRELTEEDVKTYHWGDDHLHAEISKKRKIIYSCVSKDYLKKTQDLWIHYRDLSMNNILKEIHKKFKGEIDSL